MDPVHKYAEDVLNQRVVTGKLVKLACERHLSDLESGKERGLKWDGAPADRIIRFFPTVLRLAEGTHAGAPFELDPSQKFIVGSLFGWKNDDGTRRFRNAYVEQGKGNGKSPLAAGIGLYMTSADQEQGAQCFAAAVTRDQANILFQDAVKMVDASPELSKRFQKSGNRNVFNLAHLASGSFFRPVSSEGRGLDGKRVHFAAIDEIHEHPTPIVVHKMRAGTKGRRQALIFEITNSGFDRESICWHHHEYSRKIVQGWKKESPGLTNDSWFAYICGLDEGDDWKDEAVWPKPNPLLDVSVTRKYIREQVQEALGMPIQQSIVQRLNFCIWTAGSARWVDPELWASCAAVYGENDLLGKTCYGGLDLAKEYDFSAFVLVFPGKPIRFLPYMWLPEENLQKRAEQSGVQLDAWVKAGFLHTTPGNRIDFDFIRKQIRELGEKFRIMDIAYDPFGGTQISTELQDKDGFTVEKMRQGFLSLSEPTAMLMRLLKGHEIEHNNNPLFNWMIGNVVVVMDAAGNIKIEKAKSGAHVDGPAALVNALARVIQNPEPESYYETHGLDSLGLGETA